MANTHVFETKFSKRMQATFYNQPVFRAIANFEERSNLKQGASVVRPYKSILTTQSYTRGTDLSFQTLTDTSETLTVSSAPASPFPIDDLDELQSNYSLMNEYADDAMQSINATIDGDVLSEVTNAVSTLDDGDFGGTAGNGISVDTSNILKLFTKAAMKLRQKNVDITGKMQADAKHKKMGFAVLSPEVAQISDEYFASRETAQGDAYGENGFMRSIMGFDTYVSNNCYWTAVLGMATNPTNGDTLTIGGVTVTFLATMAATAGSVHIAGSVDVTRANLAEHLNDPTETEAEDTNTGYTAFSSVRASNDELSDAEIIAQLTATNDNTADTLTLVGKGVSYLSLAETLTAVADSWTKQSQVLMFGKKGAVDMVIQAEPQVRVSDIPAQLGVYVKPYALYGKKTYREGAKSMVAVYVDASNF
jgi:hypothetical protein